MAAMTVSSFSAFKMEAACRRTRELVANNPVQPDYSREYMAVQGWPFVTALYNGLEQALKMLLLSPSNPLFTLETLARSPYGHDLEKLHAELEDDDRKHIELHFREHWNLHEYDTHGLAIGTAEQFIAHINSGGRQGGLVSWRYILIEEMTQVPSTSLWTMSELWDAVCCRIKRNVSGGQGGCSRLSRRLTSKFDRLVTGRRVPNDVNHDDLNHWHRHQNGSALAAWIDLLVKAHWDAMPEVQAPDWLRLELAKIAHEALEQMASKPADPDDAQLLHRIQTEPNLAWDPTNGTFR